MDLSSKKTILYSEQHTSPEPRVLKEINRETHLNNLFPRMISGHFQGRMLSMLSHMIQPASILEIGTYTGYSAICLSEGLREGGLIHTIEINFELEESIKNNFIKSGITEKVKIYFGNALEIIPDLKFNFDMILLDADKVNYINYYELLINRMRSGGFIIADNVLWSGKVVDQDNNDKEARFLMKFNEHVQSDERVENILLPIRDGIMLIRKK
jgi:caffeoyl-CoA O-methyltransferase